MRTTTHNTVHISLRGLSVALSFLFLNLVQSRGTILQEVALVMADSHLTSAPNPATQYALPLCTMPRGQSSGHRALAHLLASHSIATPKQAKEPIVRQIKLFGGNVNNIKLDGINLTLMAYSERKTLLAELEKKRGSKIITLILSDRSSTVPFNGIQAAIAPDQVHQITEHLRIFEEKKLPLEKVELLIYSRGGDTNSAWILVNTIRNFAAKFNVLIPVFSHSAATLISLGADEIVMTKTASISPIDPTVANAFNPKENNVPQGISVEDVSSFMSLAKDEDRVGVKSEQYLTEVFKVLAEKVHPLALGNVKRSHTQIRILARKLLELHIKSDKERIDKIIDALTEKFYSHYHLIFREEAKNFGLSNVVNAKDDEEELLWKIYKDYEKELKLKEFFDVNVFLGTKEEDTLETVTVYIESSEKSSALKVKQLVKRVLMPDYNHRLQVLQTSNQYALNAGTVKAQLTQVMTNLSNLNAQIAANPQLNQISAIQQQVVTQLGQLIGQVPDRIDISELKVNFEARILDIKWA